MPEPITIGRMTFTPAEGISDAQVARIIKQIEQAPDRSRREAAKHLKMEPLRPLKKPTVEILDLTGQLSPLGTGPLLVMPEDARRAAVVELARKRYKAWLKDPKGDPAAAKYDRDMAPILAETTTDQLVKLVESNIKPGARLEGKFAATLVHCWDELARRSEAENAAA